MKSRAGPSGGGMGMKCRNMFEPNTTKISPSKLRAMMVAIFIIGSRFNQLVFDEVMEHQRTVEIQKASAFIESPKFDGGETELPCQFRDCGAGIRIVA